MNIRFSALCICAVLLLCHNEKAISQGLIPGILARGADYGTCLYGTTRDSFIVVKNTGQVSITIDSLTSRGPDSSHFHAFQKGMIYTDSATGKQFQYPDTGYVIHPAGAGGDSAVYPYRFYARKLGVNSDSLQIDNNTLNSLMVALSGNVVQPHIWSQGFHAEYFEPIIYDTVEIETNIGNSGTASLTIDTMELVGPDSDSWKILSIKDSLTGDTLQLHSGQLILHPKEIWNVTLQFTPMSLGVYTAELHVTGYDSLGRHANDSINSFYHWDAFPYNTDDTLDAIVPGFIGAVHENTGVLPSGISLLQNYPNPFNSTTTFSFSASVKKYYHINIYDALGRMIASLPANEVASGKYSASWNAYGWQSGVYYYRASAGVNSNSFGEAKSFLLLH